MSPSILAVLLLLLVVAGSYASFRYVSALPGLKFVYLVGTEFFLVGVAFGPSMSGLIDRPTLLSLAPVFSLGLAWVGLLYGLQFNLHQVVRVPRRLWAAALVQFAVGAGAMFLALMGIRTFTEDTFLEHIPSVLALSLILSPASLPFLSLLHREEGHSFRKEVVSVRVVAALDDLYPLLGLFVLSLVALRGGTEGGLEAPWGTFGVPLLALCGISLMSALALNLLATRLLWQDRFFLVVLASWLLVAGMASSIGFSSLVAGFFSGVVVANVSRQRGRIVETMETMEKPVYLLLLVLLGAWLQFSVSWTFLGLVVGALVLVRTSARIFASFVTVRLGWVEGSPRLHATLLLPPGSMSVAMSGSYAISAGELGSPVVLVTFLMLVLSEIQAPLSMRRVNRREEP